MAKGQLLMLQRLEDISGDVLADEEYRKVVRQMIRGKAGVYALPMQAHAMYGRLTLQRPYSEHALVYAIGRLAANETLHHLDA